jgi:hypothetical protein
MFIFDYFKYNTKKKITDHKLVYIKWLDSYTLEDTWTSVAQIENSTYEVETVRISYSF